MYKLIAIDLDGTLLNSYGEVSNRNKKAIEETLKKDVEVVLTSGRPIMSVLNLANELGANNYIICGNGAITYDIKKQKTIYDRFLEKSKVLQIIKICEENSIYYNVYTKNNILTKNLSYNILFYNQENANKPDEKKTRITVMDNIYNYILEREEQDYLKITICDSSKVVFSSIIKKLRTIKDVEVLDVAHMSRKMIKDGTDRVSLEYYYTEITNTNVDKWDALSYLAKMLKIEENEIVAIGDNVNDLNMVKNAGLGIIMQNSAPYIKEQADVVVKDNDNDGVAQALEEYIIEE